MKPSGAAMRKASDRFLDALLDVVVWVTVKYFWFLALGGLLGFAVGAKVGYDSVGVGAGLLWGLFGAIAGAVLAPVALPLALIGLLVYFLWSVKF